jgi:hypothetical protein
MSMEQTIQYLENLFDQHIEDGNDPRKGGYFHDLGIYSKEDIRRRVELGYDSAKASETQTGIMKAANGGRVGFQIGGPAYDATDPIYGSSAITVTPDTIMGPQGNQIQAQTGVNPALQRSQNPFQNLGFLNTQKHFDQNQLLKNAVASGEITPEQYNELGGYDVTQTMAAGNPVMGGIGNLLGSTAYNVVQSLKGDQSPFDIPGDVYRNVKGGMGLISDDLKSKYENIINQQQSTTTQGSPDAGTNLTQYSNIAELTRVMDDNPNINSLAEADNYIKSASYFKNYSPVYDPELGRYLTEYEYAKQIAATTENPEKYMRDNRLASGGRVGYAYGSGKKLLDVLKQKGKDITQEIKKAVDNIYTTDDIKYDADVAVDDMLETLGIDRSEIDEKDILDAYGMAYDELKKPLLKKLRNKPVENLAPKMTERFELKERFPGIDEELVTKIVEDPDPQRKAEIIATIEQAFELMRQGKSSDEVLDIMKQMTDRTKQAGGGLSYLSGF